MAAHRVAKVLGYSAVNMFSSDVNKDCQRILLQHNCPHKFYPDIRARSNSTAPGCDWYGAGFPCQPFSMAGLHLGVNDHQERGLLVANSLDYVEKKRPGLVILENVPGILTRPHLKLVAWIIRTLQSFGYQTWQQILNAADFGVPHHRSRVYIVAILHSKLRRNFQWPVPVPTLPLDEFLLRGRINHAAGLGQ